MRLIVQIWMLLALLLVGRHFVKAADDVMYIDGSSGDGAVPVGGGETPDDEDNTETPEEMGSGTDKPRTKVAEPIKPSFDNIMRILKIGNKKANFIPEYNDPNSVESEQVFGLVCSELTNSLQQNQLTSMPESCEGISINSGSLVVKTKITFPEDTAISSTDVQSAIQEGLADGSTTLNVDPQSISVAPSSTEPEPTNVGEPSVPATKRPKPVRPDPPSSARPNKGNTDNDIFFPTTMGTKPPPGDGKTTMSNAIGDVDHDNTLNVKDEKEKEQNFFEMVLGNPVLLAALVGAVVLTLITIILIIMFMIYRVKKKDEGSYSLDEPHKVKDPTTYWKDTKEFYA